MSKISKEAFKFLRAIKKNNNREWFEKNKKDYKNHFEAFKSFGEDVKEGLNKKDVIDKVKAFRIYRDVRFSKDKTPFKTNFAMGWQREGKSRRGGYYLHVQPGNSFAGCGFFSPEPKDLLHIRKQIQQDPAPLRKILKSAGIKKTFGELLGDKVKSSPKGFDKNDPAIDLLRYKQFFFMHEFSDAEVQSDNFDKEVVKVLNKTRPYLNYMTDILTTDLNGVSLI